MSTAEPGGDVEVAAAARSHVAVSVSAAGAAREAAERHVATLVGDRVASRLAAHDAELWGPDAVEEASVRLGWVDSARTSRDLVPEIIALREQLRGQGVDRVVLCGMGGSSLAPEVICGTAGVPLVVLDGTDPGQVLRAIGGPDELTRTVVVVSSKSGSTVETDSQRRAFEAAFAAAGIDASGRIVVVTDPSSPLQADAEAAGYRVFLADPDVGGRYSALTAFGLVPSGLAGADIEQLLHGAAAVAGDLAADDASNPALVLGAVLGGTDPRRDKLAIVDDGSGLVGFGDWAEQLIAESTGKLGTGILPVAVPSTQSPEVRWPAPDVLVARLVGGGPGSEPVESGRPEVRVSGRLGAQFVLWESAVVVAGRLLGINPFDQPDVESAKKAARGLLDAQPDPEDPAFVDDGIEVRATPGLLDGATTVAEAVNALTASLGADGYLAVMAFLDREGSAELADVRDPLAVRTERPVTFGWGPRFLHSTGQYHKGGPPQGVYLQVTAEAESDLEVPDRPFTFGRLIAAQAAGDAQVLAEHGRPVLRLHLTDRATQLSRLVALLGSPVRDR